MASAVAHMAKPAEWGAIEVLDRRPFKLPLEFVVMSLTTGTPECHGVEECGRVLQRMQKLDMEQYGLVNIRYNFMLGSDGVIYEGRGWEYKPSITGTFAYMKGKYLHIACIGDFTDKVRPEAMYKAQWDLLSMGVKKNFLMKEFMFF